MQNKEYYQQMRERVKAVGNELDNYLNGKTKTVVELSRLIGVPARKLYYSPTKQISFINGLLQMDYEGSKIEITKSQRPTERFISWAINQHCFFDEVNDKQIVRTMSSLYSEDDRTLLEALFGFADSINPAFAKTNQEILNELDVTQSYYQYHKEEWRSRAKVVIKRMFEEEVT